MNLHFQRKPECGEMVDMIHFKHHFEEYRKIADQIRKKRNALNQKLANPEGFRNDLIERVQKSRKKEKEEGPEKYRKSQEEIRKQQLEKNPKYYNEAMQKSRKKQNEEDPERYKRAQEETRKSTKSFI